MRSFEFHTKQKKININYEWVDGWMNEWMNEWMGRWMNEWMGGWMNQWMGGWMNEWVNGWMNEWVDGWMNEWMNEWMNGSMDEWMNEKQRIQKKDVQSLGIDLGTSVSEWWMNKKNNANTEKSQAREIISFTLCSI